MNVVTILETQPWVERLGWTLLHFIWQGILIAALYAAARKFAVRAATPAIRYHLACAALGLMAMAPPATWIALQPSTPLGAAVPGAVQCCRAAGPPAAAPLQPWAEMARSFPAPLLSWVVALWFLGAAGFALRLAGGWGMARRLRRRTVRPAEPEWQRRFHALRGRIRVSRPVRLLISSLVEAPTVVGWLRPVVLIPVGALAGLPAEQVEALLLHELAHIRRHDYLINVVQGILETLLFYHPAVWWISRDIRTERELCCDDLALSVSGDALTYARALSELAAAATPRLGPAVAANGGSLAHRVARILGESRPAPRAASGPGAAAAAILLGLTGFAVFGQPAARPEFDAASIKPSAGRRFRMVQPTPGGLKAAAGLVTLMQNAYAVQEFQIVGAPEWADSQSFEIEARTGHPATRAEIFQMLQTLLEDRFHLRVHRESRELPIYALTAVKSGIKLSPPKDGACVEPSPDARQEWGGGRMLPPGEVQASLPRCGAVRVQLEPAGVLMEGGKASMAEFTRMLSLVMGRSVVDKTGVSGLFDLRLRFLADDSTPALPAPPPGAEPAPDPRYASIVTALREQLGVQVQNGRGPVDVIVIDHVEKPSAN